MSFLEVIKTENMEDSKTELRKQLKITKLQKKVLLEFLEQNFEYSKGTFKLLPTATSEDKTTLWEDITVKLNNIGPCKTSNMWRKTCADLRMQIKKKVYEERELTEDEQRFAKFYGLTDALDKNSRLMNDRVTPNQKTRMVDIVKEHFWYNRSTMKLEQRSQEALDWDDIAKVLNELGPATKNVVAWRKCWSDIKCDVGKKFTNGLMPKMVTEDEFKIAQIYGWLTDDNVPSSTSGVHQYVVAPHAIVKSEMFATEESQTIDETEYVIERLDMDYDQEHKEEDTYDDTEMHEQEVLQVQEDSEDPIYVTQTSTQTVPQENQKSQIDENLLHQILEAQQRTNSILSQILEQSKKNTKIQTEVLEELRNNSFMMVNRSFSK